MKSKPRILHIAPMNTSGVPGQFVLAERELGFESRLVTLYSDKRNYFKDICLGLPFIRFSGTKWVKRFVSSPDRLVVRNVQDVPDRIPKTWLPHSFAESLLVWIRDKLWSVKIWRAVKQYGLDRFDVYQLDGGLDVFRGSYFMKKMKAQHKKIVCCYTGSDLRTRGVIPAIDRISDLNVSVEFDHVWLHPHIHHVFFPFDARAFSPRPGFRTDRLRIGHAPTSRQAKGSDVIIPVLDELAAEYGVQVVLIEGLSYQDAIALKSSCDIFVDQIGDLGYGINSLESLAMEIPTCSCLAPGFEETFPDHPFIVIDKDNLKEQLIDLIKNPQLRKAKGAHGRQWVLQHHDARKSVRRIHTLAGIHS